MKKTEYFVGIPIFSLTLSAHLVYYTNKLIRRNLSTSKGFTEKARRRVEKKVKKEELRE
jgi:hypothetical protein